MPSDRTRTSDDLRQGYKAVVSQQGRVILDRDFNAMQDIVNGELAADVNDIVGPCGTPDNGFQISPESASSPPTLWSPPSGTQDANVNSEYDFLIGPGTMYIGGQRAVFPASSPGQPGPYYYSYFDQPDWINPQPPGSPSSEVIYLRLFEQEVSAVEDPDLLEVALGGPDTTQRVRLMRRVERCSGASCGDAATYWSQRGYTLDQKNNRLVPQVLLLASYGPPPSNADPCDPVASGGYLGAYNQLIRVELRNPANPEPGEQTPFVLWGYDNASFLYRVATLNADGVTLTLSKAPVDTFHQPAKNQVVEVLKTAAILASDPNQTDTTQPIIRCIAEARGYVTTLDSNYSPGTNGSGGTVVLHDLPADYVSSCTPDTPLFLRIWQGKQQSGSDFSLDQAITLTDNATNASIGLVVTFSDTPDASGILPDGAFWMIAVRPNTPQVVYPERFLEGAQLPDGPRQWMCPLAVLDWSGGTSSPPVIAADCRNEFDNLVELTERNLEGCCTVRVVPSDAQAPGGLQGIIDKAVVGASAVTVCFGPGVYQLAQPLRLDSSHSNITLEACQPGAILQAAQGSETGFLDGLVVLTQANNVTLEGLTFSPPIVPFFQAGGLLAGLDTATLAGYAALQLGNLYSSVGVRSLCCNGLTIRECTFNYPVFSTGGSSTPVDGFAAGILSSGGCTGLTIEANSFNGPTQPNVQLTSEPYQFLFGYVQTPVSVVQTARYFEKPYFDQTSVSQASTVQKGAPGVTGAPPGAAKAAKTRAAAKATAAKAAAKKSAAVAPPTEGAPVVTRRANLSTIEAYRRKSLLVTGTLLPSWLQDAVFRDNSFSGLTVAAFVFGETGSLRVQDNEVSNSYAGLWFFAKRSLSSESQVSQVNNPVLLDTVQDPILVVGSAIARGYPLPQGFSDPSQLQLQQFAVPPSTEGLPGLLGLYDSLSGDLEMGFEISAAQSTSPSTLQGFNFSLRCSGNQVDAEELESNMQSAGTALLVWADENASSSETLLSGNHLTNNGSLPSGSSVPAAMMVSLSLCTVTGNVISNYTTLSLAESLKVSYSLVSSPQGFFNLALTGNLFYGEVFSDSTAVVPNMAVAGNVFNGGFYPPPSSSLAMTGNVLQNNPSSPPAPAASPWAGTNWPLPAA